MPADFRFAVCNEIFGEMRFPEVCQLARHIGYSGIELTPHLFTEQQAIPSEIRHQIEDSGLEFVGLHWLLSTPPGLCVSAADPAVLRRSWDHVRRMIDVCADLGGCKESGNGLVVLGSPKQRSSAGPGDTARATDTFVHELAHVAPYAEARGVTVLLEAIPSSQTDVVNRLSEAVAIVREIGSPALRTLFDVHNASDETEPHAALIQRYCSYIRHIHVNEEDGAEPGMGDYDFESLLASLQQNGYAGWVSVESFDFTRPPGEIAERAYGRLQAAATHKG